MFTALFCLFRILCSCTNGTAWRTSN